MSGFRIIKEQTHKHKRDDTLYVLMFKDIDKFGIDLANSSECLGRIHVSDKKQAQYLFDRINEVINKNNDYNISSINLSRVFEAETFAEAVLLIHADGKHLGLGEIHALAYMLDLEIQERNRVSHVVTLFESGRTRPIGEFVSKSTQDKYYLFLL